MKKSILISGAVFLALHTVAYEALSIAPSAADAAPAVAIALPRPASPAAAIEAARGPLAIHEAHSDGGYWYWSEK